MPSLDGDRHQQARIKAKRSQDFVAAKRIRAEKKLTKAAPKLVPSRPQASKRSRARLQTSVTTIQVHTSSKLPSSKLHQRRVSPSVSPTLPSVSFASAYQRLPFLQKPRHQNEVRNRHQRKALQAHTTEYKIRLGFQRLFQASVLPARIKAFRSCRNLGTRMRCGTGTKDRHSRPTSQNTKYV